jgi:prevent-host-death family protein
MARVGAYEAKTHLSRLLERVTKGEWITITKHGQPVAVLKPVSDREQRALPEVIADLRRFRRGRTLQGISVRELIEEGRR